MVEEQLLERGIKDFRLMEVMSRVPRHVFVEESLQHRAYGDTPLPIGENQTISQPFVVAKMTEALRLKGEERVLEIGTGSGYQTAVLAELTAQVFTVERICSISQKTRKLMERLEYENVVYKVFDGTYGWKDQSPFDAILVTAFTPEIPDALINQLKDHGRLVCPVGADDKQKLVLLTKSKDRVTRRNIGDCRFVPLIGKYGWPEDE